MARGIEQGKEQATWDRQDEAASLRSEGMTLQRIADQLGYSGPSAVSEAVQASHRRNQPDQPIKEVVRAELIKLDAREGRLLEVLARDHPLVQWGKLVYDAEGNTLRDDSIVIAVYRQLNQIAERRAKLLGLDAPKKRTLWEVTPEVVDYLIAEAERDIAAMQQDEQHLRIVQEGRKGEPRAGQ